MQLEELNLKAIAHQNKKVIRVSGCKVWYVNDGRNAWHSTWVKKYRSGCFHLTLSTAKEFCESKRVQGSVFYIEELPALQIDSEHGSLFVTQINCSYPLKEYSTNAVRKKTSSDDPSKDWHKDNYLKVEKPILDAAQTFESTSRFWRTPPPTANSLIIQWLAHNDWENTFFNRIENYSYKLKIMKPEAMNELP